MIALWMAYAVVVAGLVHVAALAVDRLVRPLGGAVRWAWAGGLALGALLPLVRPLRLLLPSGAPGAGGAGAPAGELLVLESLTVPVSPAWGLARLDPWLVGLWAAASAILLAVGAAAFVRVRRLRRRWRETELRERRVLVSTGSGPAVIGLLRGRIVLPDWILDEPEERLDLILLHEEEHLRAGDLRLLAAAAALVALLPWNPALWWGLSRLREAVEVDCDRRVVGRRPSSALAYGRALLHVSRRRAAPLPAASALVEPPTLLERRIRTMTTPRPDNPVLRAALLGLLAALALGAACLAPDLEEEDATPAEPARDEAATVTDRGDIGTRPVFTPYTVKPELKNASEVMAALEDAYPPLLRDAGVGGTTVVWFFIDETGTTRNTRVAQSSGHEALDRAALEVAREMEFSAALNRDEPTEVWVQFPITFQVR